MKTRLGKDIIIYSGGEFLFKLAPLVSLPFIVRHLGPSDFGAADLLLSIINSFVIFLCFGVGSAIHRYYNHPEIDQTEKSAIISTGFVFALALTSIFFCFYFYFYDRVLESLGLQSLHKLKYIIASFIIFSVFTQLILDVIRIQGKSRNYLITAGIARAGASLLCLLFVVSFSMGLYGYFSAPALAMFLAIIIGIAIIKSEFSSGINTSALVKIVLYSWPFALLAPMQWLISGLDRYLISDTAGLTALGSYAIAAKVATIIGLFFSSVLAAWSPSAIRHQGAPKKTFISLHCMMLYGCVSAFFALCTFLYFFSEWAVIFLFSQTYSESEQYILLLVIGSALPMVSATLYTYISLSGKTYLYLFINLLAGLLALIANIFLIEHFGASGGAMSSATVGFAIFLLNYIAAAKLGFSIPIFYPALMFFLGLSSIIFLSSKPAHDSAALIVTLISFLYFFIKFIIATNAVRNNREEA